MKKSLMMDIIACPIDKQFPLELFEVRSNGDDIIDGALFCVKCKRFYPIIDEIPMLLPDSLRDQQRELDALKKWQDALPEKILRKGIPWHL